MALRTALRSGPRRVWSRWPTSRLWSAAEKFGLATFRRKNYISNPLILKGIGLQETAQTDGLRAGGSGLPATALSPGRSVGRIAVEFLKKTLDAFDRSCIIFLDDTRPDHRDPPSARYRAAGNRRDPARFADRADRASYQRLHDLRRWWRAPAVGSDHQLPRRP